MRGLRLGLAVLAVAGLGAAPPAADYWPGQAIVRVQDGTSPEAVVQVAQAVQGRVGQQIAPDTYLITFDESVPMGDALARLAQHPAVQYAEPNYRVQAF
ncbi:MAG: hypothetical protein A3C53_05900 [Omnitrophica WOR_2 bacterium RIFCSPHIGHO2_02_FULL_68_15]|nr:MAG: hypothetical protein A3C53_05900 [Omnitrophica WOR_2 bacterium RIFCSPHIGHO2_02_FULL_68_15]